MVVNLGSKVDSVRSLWTDWSGLMILPRRVGRASHIEASERPWAAGGFPWTVGRDQPKDRQHGHQRPTAQTEPLTGGSTTGHQT